MLTNDVIIRVSCGRPQAEGLIQQNLGHRPKIMTTTLHQPEGLRQMVPLDKERALFEPFRLGLVFSSLSGGDAPSYDV